MLGFGDDSVLGFGINPNLLKGRIIDIEQRYDERIIEMIDRTLERYDKDENRRVGTRRVGRRSLDLGSS